MYYIAAYVNLINSDYKLWSTAFLRSWLSLSSSGTCQLLWNLKVHYCIQKSSPFVSILHQTNLVNIFVPVSLRSVWILLCHQKWSHFQRGFLTTEYLNKIYVRIYYSLHGGCIIYVFHPTFFLSSCLTKNTHYKGPHYAVFSS